MRKAAKPWSRSSATGCAPARISPKASPPSAKRESRITANKIRTDPHIRVPAKAGIHLSASQLVERWVPAFAGTPFCDRLRGVVREDDGGHEGPGLDKGSLGGLAAELFHRAQEAEPVQHLVLPGLLDLVGRVAMPSRVIADLERAVEAAIGFDIGPELPVLLGQKRMRPARRGDKRGAPRALCHDLRRGGADLHTAVRVGPRRIEGFRI